MAYIAIVTGGRDYHLTHDDKLWLEKMWQEHRFRIVLHGGARGVDSAAAAWARSMDLCDAACPAEWKRLGKQAGHARNRRMAWACENIHNERDTHAVICLVFPGGTGTASMKRYAEESDITTFESPSRKKKT